MLEKRAGTDPNTLEVTFLLPAASGAASACVVGDFNGWATNARPMQSTGDALAVAVELEGGRTYQFRYLLDGERWENDWSADRYVGNEFGGENSVVDLTDECVVIDLTGDPQATDAPSPAAQPVEA